MTDGINYREADIEFNVQQRQGGQSIIRYGKILSKNLNVVIKLYAFDTDGEKCFQLESSILSRCRHRNIVRFIGYLKSRIGLGLILELLEGATLAEVRLYSSLDERYRVGLARIMSIEVLRALSYIHAGAFCPSFFPHGIAHGDISPQNIFVCESGRLVIIDFGAAYTGHSLNRPPFGKKKYLSPEQLDGDPPGLSSDLFSLGALIFELLMNRPFGLRRQTSDVEDLRCFLRWHDEQLFAFIHSCLSPSPLLRLNTARSALKYFRYRRDRRDDDLQSPHYLKNIFKFGSLRDLLIRR